MMELADMRDLGSRASQRAGSTPVTRTTASEGANTVPFPPCGENCAMLAPSSFINCDPLRWARSLVFALRCSSFPNQTRLRLGFDSVFQSSKLSGLFKLGNFFVFPLMTNAVFERLTGSEPLLDGFSRFICVIECWRRGAMLIISV